MPAFDLLSVNLPFTKPIGQLLEMSGMLSSLSGSHRSRDMKTFCATCHIRMSFQTSSRNHLCDLSPHLIAKFSCRKARPSGPRLPLVPFVLRSTPLALSSLHLLPPHFCHHPFAVPDLSGLVSASSVRSVVRPARVLPIVSCRLLPPHFPYALLFLLRRARPFRSSSASSFRSCSSFRSACCSCSSSAGAPSESPWRSSSAASVLSL